MAEINKGFYKTSGGATLWYHAAPDNILCIDEGPLDLRVFFTEKHFNKFVKFIKFIKETKPFSYKIKINKIKLFGEYYNEKDNEHWDICFFAKNRISVLLTLTEEDMELLSKMEKF